MHTFNQCSGPADKFSWVQSMCDPLGLLSWYKFLWISVGPLGPVSLFIKYKRMGESLQMHTQFKSNSSAAILRSLVLQCSAQPIMKSNGVHITYNMIVLILKIICIVYKLFTSSWEYGIFLLSYRGGVLKFFDIWLGLAASSNVKEFQYSSSVTVQEYPRR